MVQFGCQFGFSNVRVIRITLKFTRSFPTPPPLKDQCNILWMLQWERSEKSGHYQQHPTNLQIMESVKKQRLQSHDKCLIKEQILCSRVNNNYAYWGAVRCAVLEGTIIKCVFLSRTFGIENAYGKNNKHF